MVTFHEHTWQHLEGLASDVNLAAFKTRVVMSQLTPEQLSDWLTGRAASCDLELDFAPLVVGISSSGAAFELARERARRAYWRLLVDASQGNPEVALEYWLDTVFREKGTNRLGVGVVQAPGPKDLEAISDMELFVLTALVIHDGLTVEQVAEVLNANAGQVRTSCRGARGLSA